VENKLASLFGVTMGKVLKSLVHCFSMQVVMIKCFFLNPEKKIWRRFVLSFSRKTHL